VLSVRKDDAADSYHVHVADGFPDDGERVVPDFPIGDQVVRTDEVAGIYVALRDELVDVDCPGRFQRNVLKFVLRHLDVGVGIDLVALHDVIVGNFLAGISVHLGVFDAVASLSVDLVEADFLAIGSGRIQSDRTGNKRKAQKAFPVGTLRGHLKYSKTQQKLRN
jgi:hypothetical protein